MYFNQLLSACIHYPRAYVPVSIELAFVLLEKRLHCRTSAVRAPTRPRSNQIRATVRRIEEDVAGII